MDYDRIYSRANPQVKRWARLQEDRKFREEEGSLLVEGVSLVCDLAKHYPLRALLIVEGSEPPVGLAAERAYFISREVVDKLSGVRTSPGVLAEVDIPAFKPLDQSAERILILDRISDPGNMGTILRTAWALDWRQIFLLDNCCDPWSGKVLRAARAAPFFLTLQKGDERMLSALLASGGHQLLAADLRGRSLDSLAVKTSLALAVGSEAHGLSSWVRERAECFSIPMREEVESLNVAAAAAIALYALRGREE